MDVHACTLWNTFHCKQMYNRFKKVNCTLYAAHRKYILGHCVQIKGCNSKKMLTVHFAGFTLYTYNMYCNETHKLWNRKTIYLKLY